MRYLVKQKGKQKQQCKLFWIAELFWAWKFLKHQLEFKIKLLFESFTVIVLGNITNRTNNWNHTVEKKNISMIILGSDWCL